MQLLIQKKVDAQPFIRQGGFKILISNPVNHEMHGSQGCFYFMNPGQQFIFFLSRLKLAVSFIILLLTLLLMANFRVKETSRRDYSVGGLSGIMTTSIGMPGPPLLLYFSGTDTEKERLRGTTLAFYLFIYSASLVFQIIFAGTSKTIWLSSLYALPLVLLGLYLGQILFVKINQRFFKIFTYIILIFTGVYLLIE